MELKGPVRVRLQTEQGATELEAPVIWAGEPHTPAGSIPHGVAFTRIAPDQRQALLGLLLSKGSVRHAGARLPLDLTVTCRQKDHDGPPFNGWTANISRGGLPLAKGVVPTPFRVIEIGVLSASQVSVRSPSESRFALQS